MNTAKAGRPKQAVTRDEYVEVRVRADEKQAFREAAEVAGIPLATWIRERLRAVAIRELENAGRSVPFIAGIGPGTIR